ncbi:hypothetical protein DKE47_021990 (plasmid) [Acinetobacter nosocomialis]|nr:hypothetical protein DKE47_021990 [Acinetobacter nosocomialis]
MWDSPVTVSPFDDRYDAPVTLIPSTCIVYLPKKDAQKLIRLEYICIAYWMNENQVTKDFLLIQCLPFFINLIEFEKRYKPKGEIITVVKPYDLR